MPLYEKSMHTLVRPELKTLGLILFFRYPCSAAWGTESSRIALIQIGCTVSAIDTLHGSILYTFLDINPKQAGGGV